jgi:hypothetical protein
MFLVQPAAGAPTRSHSIADIPEIENFLLWTGHEHVPDALAEHVQQTLRQPRVLSAAAVAVQCPACRAHDTPAYNPAFWNTP